MGPLIIATIITGCLFFCWLCFNAPAWDGTPPGEEGTEPDDV